MTDEKELHRYAREMADRLARGVPLSRGDVAVAPVETEPRLVIETLEGLARQLDMDDEHAERMATAYLLILGMQLRALRFAIERQFEWARRLKQAFEDRVMALIRSGAMQPGAVSLIVGAMREAELAPGAEFVAANEALLQAETPPDVTSADLGEVLQQLAEQVDDDVFALLDTLRDSLDAISPEPLAGIASQIATAPIPLLRDAGALLTLHPVKEVRRTVALALLGAVETVSPTTLRRLILIRSWLAEDERHLIDQVVRAARTKGVSCAAWEPRTTTRLTASAIDGSGAQMVVMVSPQERRQRVSAVLLKEGRGVGDAWCRGPMTKREAGEMIDEVETAMHTRSVSRAYIDRIVCHQLGAGLQGGALPPVGLIDVAESIGAADWRPAPLDWRQVLDELVAAAPAWALEPQGIADAVEQSMETAEASGLVESWFESDQEVEELLSGAAGRDFDELVPQVLKRVIEPRKEKWIERFTWTALWMKEGEPDLQVRWFDFAILARELLQGRDLETVPLMEEIAAQTVEALEQQPPRP